MFPHVPSFLLMFFSIRKHCSPIKHVKAMFYMSKRRQLFCELTLDTKMFPSVPTLGNIAKH